MTIPQKRRTFSFLRRVLAVGSAIFMGVVFAPVLSPVLLLEFQGGTVAHWIVVAAIVLFFFRNVPDSFRDRGNGA